VTDGVPPGAANQPIAGKGHIVVKFSPKAKVLLTLGKAGVPGDGPDTFNQPSDVITGSQRRHIRRRRTRRNTNARIVKFDQERQSSSRRGKKGTAPGEFDTPHSLAMDSKGRLLRSLIEITTASDLDQDGKFLEEWKQFSRISGLYIRNDIL